MSDAREAWKAVGNRTESLGLKLKLHLEQEIDDEVDERDEGDTLNAFEDLADQVSDAFEAFGNAVRDDAVHADVRSIADALKDALLETFRTVGAEFGGLVDHIEDFAEDTADKIAGAVGRDREPRSEPAEEILLKVSKEE